LNKETVVFECRKVYGFSPNLTEVETKPIFRKKKRWRLHILPNTVDKLLDEGHILAMEVCVSSV